LQSRPDKAEVETTDAPARAVVSRLRHDLITPVNHMIGYSEMLIEELDEAQETVLCDQMRTIHRAARDTLFYIQQAFPSDQGNEKLGLNSLRLLLPQSILMIDESIENIRQTATADVRLRIDTDLGRIVDAAAHLQRMISDAPAPDPATEEEPLPRMVTAAQTYSTPEIPPGHRTERASGHVLVIDDNEANRELLCRRLQREGYQVSEADGGQKGLEMLSRSTFDLVLLDVIMPGMDGFQVLQTLRSPEWPDRVPVITISAVDEVQSAVRCIELGAEDYLIKPFDPILLRARVGACLEKKRLRDEERRTAEQLRAALHEADEQRRLAESLLLNILPATISAELRTAGEVMPKYFDDVSIVFTDFVGFTVATEALAADELVAMLHDYFTAFDRIVKRYGAEKLKTIGDSYMFLGGLPPRSASHPVDVILACMELLEAVRDMKSRYSNGWEVRIGVHTGPVIAGVVGVDKFAFDVWGETVNYGSRMESAGEAGRINISERAYARIKDFFECEHRGKVLTKEQRALDMYFVKGVQPKLMQDQSQLPPPQFARRYRMYFERELLAFPAISGKSE
jgi:adenylate cyclase